MSRQVLTFAALLAAVIAGAPAHTQEPPAVLDEASKIVEAGITYGKHPELPPPKTILFSASPEEIINDAAEWSRRGVEAFFLDYVARDWSSDIWAQDDKPWTIGASDETFLLVRKAYEACHQVGSEMFLKVAFDRPFDWFDDVAWQHIDHNFRQFAIFARDTGCKGLAIDIEYVGEQYDFAWEGYTYEGYTRKDLVETIRQRMTKLMSGLYDEFPEMVFLTFPEEGLSLGTVIHTAWIEEAARRNAPGGVHYCTEYTYRNPNVRYMFGHAWACNELFHRLLTERAWDYWTAKCSIAAGVWPLGFNYETVHDPGMPLKEFHQGYAASLSLSPRYNWIYSHQSREMLIGRGLDTYSGEADIQAYLDVIARKDVITRSKFVVVAKDLRAMRLRDYTKDLDLVPVVSFAGPSDVPGIRLAPVAVAGTPEERQNTWDAALRYYVGAQLDLREYFGTITHWMLLGPFPNAEGFSGHHAVYPPEQSIDLNAEYDGIEGTIRWIEHKQEGRRASVDLTKVFTPTEHAGAYALCYVSSPKRQPAQLRIGTNDSGKLWLGGELVYEHPGEGTAFLDRDIVSVTLGQGTTPILIKVCNGQLNWGFVLRITGPAGQPLEDLEYSVTPP